MVKKILIATLLIYYGYEGYAVWYHKSSKCTGWNCENVQCPDEYAVWIPEKGGFLPCEDFEKYIETGDLSLLK